MLSRLETLRLVATGTVPWESATESLHATEDVEQIEHRNDISMAELTSGSEVRKAVRDLDPTQPIYHVEAVDKVLSDSLARQRMVAVLLGIFALLALTLAAIGINGVVAYSVTQRTREIGLRMAVGSNRANILLLMLRDVASFTGIGVLAGLVAAIAGAHLVSTLLFETSSNLRSGIRARHLAGKPRLERLLGWLRAWAREHSPPLAGLTNRPSKLNQIEHLLRSSLR